MHKLPNADAVALTLTTFLRRKVQVVAATPPDHLPILGLYRSTAEHNVASCESDVAFAAITSAAFALIPAAVAQESVKSGKLDESLEEIYGEVLNVLSRLFSDTDGLRITLTSTTFPPAPLPEIMSQRPEGGVVGFEVSVDGYGKGLLSLGLLEAV